MISPSISGGNIRGGSTLGGEEIDGGAGRRRTSRHCPSGWHRSRSMKAKFRGKCVKRMNGKIHHIGMAEKTKSYHRRFRSGEYKGRHISSIVQGR